MGSAFAGIGAADQLDVLGIGGDLDLRVPHAEANQVRVIPEPFDLAGSRGSQLIQAVSEHELVPEEERRLRPDQDVPDPAPIPATPLGGQTVVLSARDTDRAAKDAVLPHHPALARDHERGKHHQDDQVDPEEGEKRDQHGATGSFITITTLVAHRRRRVVQSG
jgi:hypothetical protein